MRQGANTRTIGIGLLLVIAPSTAEAKRFAIACEGITLFRERNMFGPGHTDTQPADRIYVIDEDLHRAAQVLTGPPRKLEDLCGPDRSPNCSSSFSDVAIYVGGERLMQKDQLTVGQTFRYDRKANTVESVVKLEWTTGRMITMTYSMKCVPTDVPDLPF